MHLDGLLLALELAAARSKLLPPQALLKRLSHRLELLTGGAQDLPARQQTLRNTLQWSYDLLTEPEQRLFRWLSIFVGGCTLEAAETVCQGERADSEQAFSVLEGITSLLDKSLVQQTEREGDAPRLVMLEMLREFGLECLEREGELEAARRAHAHYYLTLAEQAEPHLFGPEQLLWFARLEQDLNNLRVILQAGITGGMEEREVALRLGAAMRLFWSVRGYLREGRSVLERLLTGAGTIAAPVRLKALNTLGAILWSQNDARGLEPVADEALALAREQGDQWQMTRATIFHGVAMMQERRDYAQAQACLEEALTSARVLGDRNLLFSALMCLGRLAWYQQDAARAIAWFEESLIQCRAMGDKVPMGMALVGLARAELSLSHGARARTQLGEPVFEEARARGRTMTPAQALTSPEAFVPQTTPRLPPAQAVPGSSPAAPAGHPSSPAGLTAREVEILRLLAQGKTDAQIAEQLVISPRTVNWHLTAIYSKLGVSSRAAATRYALDHALV